MVLTEPVFYIAPVSEVLIKQVPGANYTTNLLADLTHGSFELRLHGVNDQTNQPEKWYYSVHFCCLVQCEMSRFEVKVKGN